MPSLYQTKSINQMETIEQYKANDGKIFNDYNECIRYEGIYEAINIILKSIPTNNYPGFENGEGFIQHKSIVKEMLINALLELSNKWFDPKEKFTSFNYYLGRVIDDSDMSCLNKLTYKIQCIDQQNREWGQPFFAIHSDKGTQKQLN